MGSDAPPQQLFQGVLRAAEYYSQVEFVVLATPALIELLSIMANEACAKLLFHAAKDAISMEDDPLLAVRRKKDSSLMAGMRLLKTGEVDVLVSAGNTGALIASASILLRAFSGIRRPALLALLPSAEKMLAVIDVGGSVKSTSASLVQCAHMGIAYQQCCAGIEMPTVGLLNIGSEASKGTSQLKETYMTLQSFSELSRSKFHFAGNVEARDIFDGQIDVLVTDGFTGNILLKAVEGTAAFVLNSIVDQLQDPSPSAVKSLQSRFDDIEYSGALVCGVDGIVIKCHGNASEKSIYSAICQSISLLKRELIQQMRCALDHSFPQSHH